MYLKRLEVAGFKSFVSRTSLEFSPGITAIVGPNGSGKSNLVDAVRWAVGEQSAKNLRAGRMEDVIFHGNQERRPVGRAEVTIAVDNNCGSLPLAFTEVAFTRRLFRSGQSEYLLNQASCRLRDFQELLWETGKITVVGQGELDYFLQASPQERRQFLEQAVGLQKYEARRKDTQRKLEETETNLVRLGDVLAEIEQHLSGLEDKVHTAREYRRLQARLEGIEAERAVLAANELAVSLEALNHKYAQAAEKVAAAAARLQAGRTAHLEANQALEASVSRQETRQSAWEKVSREEAQLQARLETCQREILSLERQAEVLAGEQQRTSKRLEAMLREEADSSRQLQAAKQAMREAEETLASLEGRLARAEKERAETATAVPHMQSRLMEMAASLAGKRNEISLQEQAERILRQEVSKLEKEALELAQTRASLEEKRQSLVAEGAQLLQKLGELAAEREELGKQVSTLEAAAAEVEGQYRDRRSEFDQAAAQVQVLRRWQDNYEGYYPGVKAVLAAKDKLGKLDGIVGTVAGLLEVPSEYEVAVEVALGAAAQIIITRTPSEARAAIEYLKSTRAGRATFLPLTVARPRPLPVELLGVLQWPEVIGLAAGLVRVDADYAAVAGYFLGDILVVRGGAVAWKLAGRLKFRVRIVTLDGELISPGGLISGGRQRGGSHLLGRARELRELEAGCTRLEGVLAALRSRLEELRSSREMVGSRMASLEAEVGKLREQERSVEQGRARLEAELEGTAARREVLDFELAQARAEMEEASRNGRELTAAAAGMAAGMAVLQEDLRQAEAAGTRQEEERQALREEANQVKLQREKWQQEIKAAERAMLRRQEEIGVARAELAERKSQLEEISRQAAAAQKLAGELDGQLQALRGAVEAAALSLDEARKEVGRGQEACRHLEAECRQLEAEVGKGQAQVFRLDLERTRLQAEYEHKGREMAERFQLAAAQAREFPVSGRSQEDLARESEGLTTAIRELGEVNLGVLGEYARLDERRDFLRQQQEDLLNAKNSLQRIMDEVTALMARHFSQQFELIAQAFSQVFQRLFRGGRAQLYLNPAGEVLATGVEITVQPPGKKLQSLSLLSGGEKSLTAIALLLAILQVRPTPFCLFDEIDAALDEANVDRFAALLREMAGNNQFILVTHRPGSMEVADLLYGVAMDEPGVSRIYSLRLPEAAAARD
ncbi:MAG: chromosome segregation protein SMC [Clostridia bacterium]|nr:MAG: chromosome segregation protein SMC [Clostridia bacterium]